MKHFFTQEPISKYEVQIKSGILVIALLLFIYSSRDHAAREGEIQKYYEHTNTR